MRRQHRALPWISRKLVGVCCAALHGLRELARVAPQNGTAVFYDWCAFSEVRRRGNRDTICCAAIGCHDVLNGFAFLIIFVTTSWFARQRVGAGLGVFGELARRQVDRP